MSIGLPVYNGQRYLAEALESHLKQTFEDFEIIISDNASTDRTPEICREFGRLDSRIRYFRNGHNIGVIQNHNRTVELATGEFFKWSAADDVYAPTFLQRCVDLLDADSSAILAFSQVKYINEHSVESGVDDRPFVFDSERPSTRFEAALWSDCVEEFGLIRRAALTSIPRLGSYPHYDGVHLARLALIGRFLRVPESLVSIRRHSEQVHKRRLVDLDEFVQTLDPELSGRWLFPRWRLVVEYLRAIRGAQISLRERISCYRHLGRWTRWSTASLREDIKVNTQPAIHGLRRVRSSGN